VILCFFTALLDCGMTSTLIVYEESTVLPLCNTTLEVHEHPVDAETMLDFREIPGSE
jgi:hypothetical protein